MGNRAVITNPDQKFGIYLHWNGGIESVLAFAAVAKEHYRDPVGDESYAFARLTGLIALYFGIKDDTSLGIGTLKSLDTDNGDNGTYIIGSGWQIVDRKHARDTRKTVDELNAEERAKHNSIVKSLRKYLQRTAALAEEIEKEDE